MLTNRGDGNPEDNGVVDIRREREDDARGTQGTTGDKTPGSYLRKAPDNGKA